jgi:hypothetical protein
MDEHEDEPKCLVGVAVALVQDGGLQRIETIVPGIGGCGTDLAAFKHTDISHTTDALYHLLYESLPSAWAFDAW